MSKLPPPAPVVRFDAAAVKSGQLTIPKAALRFEAAAELQPADADGTIPITIVARSGNVLKHWYWGAIVHDFAGMRAASEKLPIDYCHNENEVLGYSDQTDTSAGQLVVSGVLIPFRDGDRVDEITHKASRGFEYQASIYFDPDELVLEFVPEGFTAAVNGGHVDGPCVIAREWMLRGNAIAPYGKDPQTSAQFSASQPGDEVAVCFQEPAAMKKKSSSKLSAAKPNRHERRKAASLKAGKAKVKLTAKTATQPAGKPKTKFDADAEEEEDDEAGEGDDDDDDEEEEELEADDEAGEQEAEEEGEEETDAEGEGEGDDDEEGTDPAEMEGDGEEKCKQSSKAKKSKLTTPTKGKSKLASKPVSKAASDVKKYITAFGPQGGVWFSEGKSFAECQTLFTSELQKENAQLQKKVASQAAQLAAARGDDPASFSSAEEASGKKADKPNGLSDNQAKFAATIKLPK